MACGCRLLVLGAAVGLCFGFLLCCVLMFVDLFVLRLRLGLLVWFRGLFLVQVVS